MHYYKKCKCTFPELIRGFFDSSDTRVIQPRSSAFKRIPLGLIPNTMEFAALELFRDGVWCRVEGTTPPASPGAGARAALQRRRYGAQGGDCALKGKRLVQREIIRTI
eukprot:EG_transcript_20156